MKFLITLLLLLLMSGCATVSGDSEKEQRESIKKMKDDALTELYKKYPKSRDQIKNSKGFAVFSTIHTNIVFAATDGGYGVAIDNQTKKKTYMEMIGGGIGPGIGIKATRIIFIFKKKHDFENLIDDGWEFGAEIGATAKLENQGGEIVTATNIDKDITVYHITKSGIDIEATLDGSKYSVDEDLN